MRRAVFLDRDGVVNRAVVRDGRPFPPSGVEELEILPEAAGAVDRLRLAGFLVIVVTNQPDLARGLTTRDVVDQINEKVNAAIDVDEVVVCPHDDGDGCACRKPRPGMLTEAAARLGIDLGSSFMVGDRWRDIGAGRRARCRTIFIDRGYDERQPTDPDAVVNDLGEAAQWIARCVCVNEPCTPQPSASRVASDRG